MVGAVWESESCCDDALYKGNIAGLSCTRNRSLMAKCLNLEDVTIPYPTMGTCRDGAKDGAKELGTH